MYIWSLECCKGENYATFAYMKNNVKPYMYVMNTYQENPLYEDVLMTNHYQNSL